MSEIRHRVSEKWTIFRTIHIVVGIFIIIMSIIAFINPDENRLAFPAIFAMGSFLNIMEFVKSVKLYSGSRRDVIIGLLNGIIGLALAVIAIIAVVSL